MHFKSAIWKYLRNIWDILSFRGTQQNWLTVRPSAWEMVKKKMDMQILWSGLTQHYICTASCNPLVGIISWKTGFELGHLEASIWQKIRVGWECGKKAAPFVNSCRWSGSLDQTKVRELNVQRGEERQKDDMQGPLGQLDSHENEITILLFILQLLSLSKNCSKSRKLFEETFTGFLKSFVDYGWPTVVWSSLDRLAMVCYNHLIQTWNGDKV